MSANKTKSENKKGSPINSVALTCDFFRVKFGPRGFENFQTRNLGWLENIIGSKSDWNAFGIKKSVISVSPEPENFKRILGNKSLLSGFLNDPDQTWATLYDSENLSAFAEVFDELFQHDLIVGFELPPSIKRAIHLAGKRYVSFYVHPVRFLRDLCFFVTTNSKNIADAVKGSEISANEIDYQVRRYKALFSLHRPSALCIPENIPILIGQTEKDSSLIRDARFANWTDFEDYLAELIASYSEIIFLEHPYCPNSFLATEYLRNRHGKTVISMRCNSYGIIFSNTRIPFFLTLSSSLGVEARCAMQECTFLLNDPREKFLVNGIDIPNNSMVSHSVLQDLFWKQILFGERPKRANKRPLRDDFFLGDHYIRNSCDAWGFRALRSGLSLDPVRKVIMPATSLDDERLNTLRDILGDSSSGDSPRMPDASHIKMPWGEVDTTPKPFILDSNSYIDFSQPTTSCYFVQGFHGIETWGVWSSSKYAKMILPVDLSGKSEVELHITMALKVFEGIMVHAPVVQILVNNWEIGFALFRKSSKNMREIHFSIRVDKPICQIEFYISHIDSPIELGLSPDNRQLGFGLEMVRISVAPVSKYEEIANGPEGVEGFEALSEDTVMAEDEFLYSLGWSK